MIRLLQLLAGNVNTLVFTVGLIVLCSSVAQWSAPLAGTILGAVLMTIAVWPLVAMKRRED